jgi:hypothetical protein
MKGFFHAVILGEQRGLCMPTQVSIHCDFSEDVEMFKIAIRYSSQLDLSFEISYIGSDDDRMSF